MTDDEGAPVAHLGQQPAVARAEALGVGDDVELVDLRPVVAVGAGGVALGRRVGDGARGVDDDGVAGAHVDQGVGVGLVARHDDGDVDVGPADRRRRPGGRSGRRGGGGSGGGRRGRGRGRGHRGGGRRRRVGGGGGGGEAGRAPAAPGGGGGGGWGGPRRHRRRGRGGRRHRRRPGGQRRTESEVTSPYAPRRPRRGAHPPRLEG